ncbi:hypothetical protein AT251_22930 [Enterovibrio nigricans]|nr:hypothetical protein AT251_22930 [Enterovibrio nigricans]
MHFVKKTRHHKQTGNYLGRYLKRPRSRPHACGTTAVAVRSPSLSSTTGLKRKSPWY